MPQARLPSIAVVFPNRNDSKHLCTCLDSILNQDVPPDELVIVDDQSTDDSVSIIRERIEGYSWARLLTNPVNIGANRSVDIGLQNVKSDFVLTLSSNDFVLPGIFARAKSCLARFPSAGVWSAMACFANNSDKIVGLHASPVISHKDEYFGPEQCAALSLKFGSWFASNTMIFRRKALLDAGGFNPDYKGLSDLLVALVIACREGAAYSPEPLGVLRLHPDGLLEKSLNEAKSLDALLQVIRANGPRWEPTLFTDDFLVRLELRLYFAHVRLTDGRLLPDIAARCSSARQRALDVLHTLVPKDWSRLRVGLAFLILRPFDILPTLWYRAIRTALIQTRGRLKKRY